MSSERAARSAAGCGAFLLLACLAVPWAGWEGLRTAGPAVCAAALGCGAVAAASPWRHRRKAAPPAIALGAAACALFAVRLASPPSNPLFAASRSTVALVLGLTSSVFVALSGAFALVSVHQGDRGAPLRLEPDQRAAGLLAWRAVWSSRVVVWTAGMLGLLKLGIEPSIRPGPLTVPFGSFGHLLTAPASAWDASGYLGIAQFGYAPRMWRAFFPLYPALVRAFSFSPGATLLAGIVISLAAFLAALYLLHRLVALECGSPVADTTVLLVAFSPMSLFFSAVYTESLFLMLSVASFYCARRGWWARAGVCGALAAGTRVNGVVLILPLLWLHVFGPREDGPPTRRLQRDSVFLLLVPLGAAAYFIYTGAHGDLLAPLHALRTYWHRSFAPGLGIARGVRDAVISLHQLLVDPAHHVLATASYQAAGQLSDPLKLAAANLTDFGFLGFGVIACVGVVRRLPGAYGLYTAVAIFLTASSVPPYEPLASFPRYLLVLFPCQIWLALRCRDRPRRQAALVIGAGLLGFFASQFATWRWVA